MVRKHNYAGQRAAHAGDRVTYPMGARIRNEAGVTRIDVYDNIDADGDAFGGGLSAKDFAARIAGVKGALEVHVSSAGGDVWDGLTIMNAIAGHKGRTTTVVDGLAASIASVIVQAGQTRVVADGSMLMVHDAFGLCQGDAREMSQMAATLDKVSDNIAGIYAQRSGRSQQQWRQAMKTETWYDADEAVAAGLADKVGERGATLPDPVDLAALGAVPGRIAARLRALPTVDDPTPAMIEEFRAALQAIPGPGRAYARPRVTVKPGAVPGEALNGYPWAKSWAGFLGAVSDKDDGAGALAVIGRVMEETGLRPKNANLSERIPAEGGFLVPENLRAQVLTYMMGAIIRPRSLYVPMNSLRVPIPLLDNPSQASSAQALGGMTFALVQEGATIPSSTPNFGRLTLEAWKVAGYLASVPNELAADSPAFSDIFLPRTIGQGLAWLEDDLMINTGTGVGEPQALLNAPGGFAVSRSGGAGKVVHLDIVTMLKGLHPASKASATWLLSESAFDQLLELYEIVPTAPSGQDIAPPQTLVFDAEAGTWKLLGVPAVVNDHQPAVGSTGDVMLVDLGLFLLGDRGAMTVERSQKGTGFISDTSNYRIRHRVDGRFWPQSNITLTTGQVTSPLVILH